MSADGDRFLDKKSNVMRLFRGFAVVSVLIFLLDIFDYGPFHLKEHAHYSAERWFGFYGIYAFVGVVLLVFLSRLLRRFVARDEDYYDR